MFIKFFFSKFTLAHPQNILRAHPTQFRKRFQGTVTPTDNFLNDQ